MKRIGAVVLCICLLFPLCIPVHAQQKQHDYSTSANSGIRHEVCTTLLGTRAEAYYTGSYRYEILSQLSGTQLLSALRTLMTATHTTHSTYRDCRDMAVRTDCENGDGTTISLIYTGYRAGFDDFISGNTGWNREHIWPQSMGDFGTSGAGADLHHVRPVDSRVNTARDNLPYGEAAAGEAVFGQAYTGSAPGGRCDGEYFEPLDNVKGDVARICLYMYVRYGSQWPLCSDLYNVFQDIDVLLLWCALDPVDTWEMGRNEVVAAYQGNRNVFIDYPELAWLLFDEALPGHLVTPSGEAAKNGTAGCAHTDTVQQNSKSATCTVSGYTGDLYCTQCGQLLTAGTSIPAPGHQYGPWSVTKEATIQESGLEERACTHCEQVEAREIPRLDPPETVPETTPTAPETTPTGPSIVPTELSTVPTEPATVPTEPSTAPIPPAATAPKPTPNPTVPGTTATAAPPPATPEDPEDDHRWLVWSVLSIGAAGSIAAVLLQRRKKTP